MLLKDRVAIVSGIGPGMGRDISLALAREGADVVLAARGADKLARRRRRGARPRPAGARACRPTSPAPRTAGGWSTRRSARVRPHRRAGQQRLQGRRRAADRGRRSRRVAEDLRRQRVRLAAAHPGGDPAHAPPGRRVDRLHQLDVDARHRAALRRLRRLEGRADDRRPDARPRARAATRSASTASSPATSGARRCRAISRRSPQQQGTTPDAVYARSPRAPRSTTSRPRRRSPTRWCSSPPTCHASITGQALDVNGGHFFH